MTLLTGLDGDYIWRKKDKIGEFSFCNGIDNNFMQIINSILPLVGYYDRIESFSKEQLLYKRGTTNNALGDMLLSSLKSERVS